ncbi:hypothetical protein FKN01_12615 [Streptomyces sp. 130]|nr:hypothetical protein FKN01_12615 [Streptomyces sp. 130]
MRVRNGTIRTVAALRSKIGLTNQQVYDLTVDNLHTFCRRR